MQPGLTWSPSLHSAVGSALVQVKKSKKFKRDRRRHLNAFQKLQSRRNFWSVTHPAKVASLSYRL